MISGCYYSQSPTAVKIKKYNSAFYFYQKGPAGLNGQIELTLNQNLIRWNAKVKNNLHTINLPLIYKLAKDHASLIIIADHIFPKILDESADTYNPAVVANYIYDLTKLFNQFYNKCPVLKEENKTIKGFRIKLIYTTANIIKNEI